MDRIGNIKSKQQGMQGQDLQHLQTAETAEYPHVDEYDSSVTDEYGQVDLDQGAPGGSTQAFVVTREHRARSSHNLDTITGLPKESVMYKQLSRALDRAGSANQTLALMAVEIEGVREMQKILGRVAGRKLLALAGDRLVECVGERALTSRINGQTFLVVLPGMDDPEAQLEAGAELIDTFNQPLEVPGHQVHASASVGIACFPADGLVPDELVSNADLALGFAQRKGSRQVMRYHRDMHADVSKRLLVEAALREALRKDELDLHYQPRVDPGSLNLLGVEALLRWHHAAWGDIPPNRFIPVAEEAGLMQDLGDWVLDRVVRQYQVWCEGGLHVPLVSVNVSSQQFHGEGQEERFLEAGRRIAELGGVLELELIESTIMHNAQRNVAMMQRLRDAGIAIAVDDFGTGFSSLAYLKRLPIDVLKIDRSFIKDLASDRDSTAIVNTIIALAKNLDLRVVAEGVETERQLNFLHVLGCDEIQGFLVGRPMSPNELSSNMAHVSVGSEESSDSWRRRRSAGDYPAVSNKGKAAIPSRVTG